MGRPVAFFEIVSGDARRAKEFYSELFGWVTAEQGGDYALVDTQAGDGAIGGGIGPAQGAGEAGVKIYVGVEDLEKALDRATALGGATLVEPTPLPGDYGRFAVFADPDGNPVGLWG
ncbi:glyoxalase [Actinoplanes ianthinogenes]|uniref:Glyoxalase n=1 Tax=Actinoplanes ianthinogenes TaxID=122358 RepID=A0ABM7LJJ8_9ACTN|nr:VOC family protein [Actinoplanes ianthinogenes]BCJ39430.1 glyoxalase [Actinoplanes ianthinogenes]GGR36161.1 glyoxalase [Actinoplanes ianthinogenes]